MKCKFGIIASILLIFMVVEMGEADQNTGATSPIGKGMVALHAANSLSSIGPFKISSEDSSSSIQFKFVGQLWLLYKNLDNGSGADRTQELFMEARRVRLTLTGTAADPALSYQLHLSTGPNSLELMDIYVNYNMARSFNFRFGQYKIPFTRYRIQSFQRLSFVDWAIVSKYFGAERQMGFAMHNGYERPAEWGYVLGIFSGVNARASHAIGLSKVYGEIVTNPSDLANPGPSAKFHPEVLFHLSYNANSIDPRYNGDEMGTGLRYSLGLSLAWDLEPTEYQDFRVRFAPEMLAKYRSFALLTIGYTGFSDIGSDKAKHVISGGLLQISYNIMRKYEISLRYAAISFKDGLRDDAYARAQQLITDSGNDADVIAQYKNVGMVKQEEELSLGFAVYFLGHSLKWQNDVSWLGHEYRDKIRDDYTARSQFQIAF